MEGPAAKAEMEGRAAKAEVEGPAVESTIDRGQRQAQGQEPWHGTCAASAMTVPLVCEEFSPRGCDNKARLQPTATQTSPRSRATKQSKNWSPWGGGTGRTEAHPRAGGVGGAGLGTTLCGKTKVGTLERVPVPCSKTQR